MATTRLPETKEDSTVVILKTLPEKTLSLDELIGNPNVKWPKYLLENPYKKELSPAAKKLSKEIKAVKNGQILIRFIKESKPSPETERKPDAEGKSLLDKIEAIIKAGADVNTIDEDNKTALHYAATYKCIYIAALLMSHGATVDEESTKQHTSFFAMINNALSAAASKVRNLFPSRTP